MPRASSDFARLLAMARNRPGVRVGAASPLPTATEHHDLAVATTSIPRPVVCLESALQFHDIGTQLPAECRWQCSGAPECRDCQRRFCASFELRRTCSILASTSAAATGRPSGSRACSNRRGLLPLSEQGGARCCAQSACRGLARETREHERAPTDRGRVTCRHVMQPYLGAIVL